MLSKRFACAMLAAVVLCGVAWASTIVQTKSGYGPYQVFDSPPDDSSIVHAVTPHYWARPFGLGTYDWTEPELGGDGLYHSYAVGPFAQSGYWAGRVQGAPGRTPPPVLLTIEEIAP